MRATSSRIPRRFLFIAAFLLACAAGRAEYSKSVAIEMAAGLPQLISLQAVYLGMGNLAMGVGVITAPLNSYFQSQVPTSPIPLNLGLSDSYSLVPATTFGFTGGSAFLRYLPSGPVNSGWLYELNISLWNLTANVTGALLDTTTGASTPNAINGSVNLLQPVLSAMIGYQVVFTSSFFAKFQLGASYLLGTGYTTTISGDLTSILPLAGPSAQANFNAAKDTVKQDVQNGINKVRSYTNFLPAIAISAGYAF